MENEVEILAVSSSQEHKILMFMTFQEEDCYK